MKSKTSFFNKYLYTKTLFRFWPLWTVVSIGGCILSVMIALSNFIMNARTVELTEFVFLNEAVNIFPWVTFFYDIVVAMCVWDYLYHRNSNFQFHSMPVSRLSLFVTNYAAGLTICLIPFVIAAVLQVIVLAGSAPIHFPAFMYALATAICESMLFFSLATLVAFITSNIVALPSLYFIFSFLAAILENETWAITRGFYPGYGSKPFSLNFLSPIGWVITAFRLDYEKYYPPLSEVSSFTNIELVGGEKLWYLPVVSIILSACAFLLYKCKKNEDVGMAVSVRWLRPVLLAVLTYASALGGGIIIWYISRDFSGRTYYSIPIMSALSILCGAIAFMVGLMILKRTTRVFSKKNTALFAGFATFIVLLYSSIGNDWFCIARSIPELSEIESVTVSADMFDYTIDSGKSNLLAKVLETNSQFARESEYIKSITSDSYSGSDYKVYETVSFVYKLKNGKQVIKQYNTYFTKERMEQPGTFEYKTNELTNDPYLALSRAHLTGADKITEIYIHEYSVNKERTITGGEMEGLLNAIHRDVIENGSLSIDWFYDVRCYDYSFEMIVRGDDVKTDYMDSGYAYGWYYCNLEETMTNTVNYLLEHGLISEETLKGNAEEYDETYK